MRFPDDAPQFTDFIPTGFGRPKAWHRFGKICLKEMTLDNPENVKELAQWLMASINLAYEPRE